MGTKHKNTIHEAAKASDLVCDGHWFQSWVSYI